MTLDEKVDAILASVRNLEKRMATTVVKAAAAKSKVEPADDSDLDSEWGNPAVRKDPPRWKGTSFVGCKFSECSAEYLDDTASFLMWKAGKNDADEAKCNAVGDAEGAKKANKYAFYARKDAARAAGWAARVRDGYAAENAAPALETETEIPF